MIVEPCLSVLLEGRDGLAGAQPAVFENLVVQFDASVDVHGERRARWEWWMFAGERRPRVRWQAMFASSGVFRARAGRGRAKAWSGMFWQGGRFPSEAEFFFFFLQPSFFANFEDTPIDRRLTLAYNQRCDGHLCHGVDDSVRRLQQDIR